MIAKVFPYVILFLWGCAFPACASDEILSGLSENKISITTSFTGSELLVFGSIKRDTSTSVRDSDVIIEIIGPELPITVRKKRKVLGIWVNTNPVKINDSPSFYAILHTNFPELIFTALISPIELLKITKLFFIIKNIFLTDFIKDSSVLTSHILLPFFIEKQFNLLS